MGEIIFHVFLMAVLGVFYGETAKINTARMTDPIGPAGFPQMIIIVAFILLAISLASAFRKYKEAKDLPKGKIKELDPGFLALIAALVAFILFVNQLGFWISSIALISIVLVILGQRKVSKVVIITLCASLVFTLVFGKILHVPLPRGAGPLKMISYFLY
jgi:hypothetical protein